MGLSFKTTDEAIVTKLYKLTALLSMCFGAVITQDALGFPPQQSVMATDEPVLEKALTAYEQGRLKDAELSLRRLVVKYPNNLTIVETIGGVYAEQDRVDEALPYLQRSVKLAPQQAVAHANLGAAFSKMGRDAEAVRELQAAVELDPKNGENQSNLGHELMLLREAHLAVKAFAAASSRLPDDSDVRYNWALALYADGAFAESAGVLRAIPATNLTDQIHALAGDANEKSGNYQEAMIQYRAAAQLNPSDPNLYALTLELLRHWTWSTAAEVATYGASRYPTSTHFQVAEGIAQYANNDYVKAAETFAPLLLNDSSNALYADLLGRSCSLLAEGTVSGCMELEDFARRFPKNAQVATYAATTILRRSVTEQDIPAVQALLKQAITADPQLAEAYYQQAVLDQQLLKWQESAVDLERAIRLRPSYAEAHYRLARAYSHLGAREQARKEIELQQRYTATEKERLDVQLKEVTTFIVDNQTAQDPGH